MVKKVMQKLLLSCSKATELIEKQFHFELSFRERLQLKMHKSMCEACARYENQSVLIEEGIKHLHKQVPNNVDIEKLKHKISESLNRLN